MIDIETRPALEVLTARSGEIDALASASGSPFLTSAWLDAWVRAFAPNARYVLGYGPDGRPQAGACVMALPVYGLGATANLETGDWSVVGNCQAARAAMWRYLAAQRYARLRLTAVPDTAQHAGLARTALEEAGYRVAQRASVDNPRVDLPASYEELLGNLSRNTRQQFRRRRDALGRLGRLELKTATTASLERDLATFLRLEAGGWKGRAGTAIASDLRKLHLYRRFARVAASQGMLRLQLLEVDGFAVAADFSCVYDGGIFMLKTAYDETLGAMSPGLVLRGETLRAAIREGLRFYDMLGMADVYKMRWGCTLNQHVTLSAHRGPAASLVYQYHSQLRPRLKQSRALLQQGRARLSRATRDQSPSELRPPRQVQPDARRQPASRE